MNRRRSVLLLSCLLLAGAAAFLLPRWLRDPKKLVLGEWRDSERVLLVTIGEEEARWQGKHRGKLRYRWLQAEHSPYEVELLYRRERITAELRFEDDDVFLLAPRIMERLPESARELLRSKNRAKGRPEDEFIIRFRREATPRKQK